MRLRTRSSVISNSQMPRLPTSRLRRQRCKSMSDDVEPNDGVSHLQAAIADIGSSPSTGDSIVEGRYYSFVSPTSATTTTTTTTITNITTLAVTGGSEVITGLKGFVDPLNPSPDDETVVNGINTLIQVYRTLGQGVSSNSDELRDFVNFYCEKVIITVVTPPASPGEATSRTTGSIVQVDSFSCPVCYGIFIDPVTIRCGHSYCRKCLHKEKAGKSCRRCKHILGTKDISRTKVNVLVNSLVQKWWPNYVTANNLRNEGNVLYDENQGDQALIKYSQAIAIFKGLERDCWNWDFQNQDNTDIGLLHLGKGRNKWTCQNDHLSLGNRAQTLLTLGRSEEALKSAEAAIKSCSVWAKGYFRKAVTLASLGRYEEAFITLTVCLYLVKATKVNDETAVIPLKCEIVKVLHKIFLQSAGGAGNFTGIRRGGHTPRIPLSPYPTAMTRRERAVNRSTMSNNAGNEIVPTVEAARHTIRSVRTRVRAQRNRGSTTIAEQNVKKIYRVFSRAVQETKRIQKEVIERTKTVADHPRISTTTVQPRIHTATSAVIGNVPLARRGSVLRPVDRSLISATDFECTLCYRLLYQPVTTICGHTFCRCCMERSLDHSSSCPLCKSVIQEGTIQHKSYTTYFIEIAMQEFLSDELEERTRQHHDEVAVQGGDPITGLEIPIFVCTVGFPTVPCPLHVFEPRYRLMIRRAMENGTRRFGMCCYSQEGENNYADHGTLLEIKNVQYFADGRSVIETVGVERFKVLRRAQKDGYYTAVVEIIHDCPVEPADRLRVQESHDKVYSEATEWLKSINQILRQRITTHFGTMPSPEQNWMELPDGPGWAWWLLAILPLDTKAQLAILTMNKFEVRLESILKVLTYVKSNKM